MRILSAGIIILMILSSSVYGDDETTNLVSKRPDWRFNVGWAAGSGPQFFGSASNEFKHRPMIDIRYKDRLQIFGPKIRYNVYRKKGFAVGPLLNYSFGRKENDSPFLEGLGDNSNRVELGVFLHYKHKPTHFEFRLEGKSGLGEGAGEVLTATLIQGVHKSDKTSLLLVLRGQYFSQATMQREFGVTSTQAANSVQSIPAFRPSGGISNTSAFLLGEIRVREKTSLMLVGAVWQLMDEAEKSPLVQSHYGSSFQKIFGVALLQKF